MKKTVPSLSFLAIILVLVGNLLVSGCAQGAKDPQRDAMVSSYNKLRPIIQRVLKVDMERVLLIATWSDLGLPEIDSDKGHRLRAAINKEFKKDVPENLFGPDTPIGDTVRYIAVECYGADFNKPLESELNSTLMAPHFRKQIKKDLGLMKEESAEEELYPSDAISDGEKEEAKEEAKQEEQKEAAEKATDPTEQDKTDEKSDDSKKADDSKKSDQKATDKSKSDSPPSN